MDPKLLQRFRRKLRVFEALIPTQRRVCCAGVTLAQCHALLALSSGGPMTAVDLSKRLNLDASTLSRTVDRLVESNLVWRGPHPGDRRAFLLKLTEHGMETAHTIDQMNNDLFSKVFDSIPATKHLSVIRNFELLVDTLERELSTPTQGVCCESESPEALGQED